MNKETYVHQVFETIADNYDAANQRISMGMHIKWKKAAVKMFTKTVVPNASYMDLCCGTGDMIQLILNYAPNSTVTGVDFSGNMLNEARKRAGENKRITFVEGNAMSLPFEDNAFDGVIISFALRNTADYGKVISEMVRVTKSGGRICIVDSFVPTAKIILPFYRVYFSLLMPIIGGGIKRHKEYEWLNQSTENFISPEELKKLSEKYICNIEEKQYMFGSCVCICGEKR